MTTARTDAHRLDETGRRLLFTDAHTVKRYSPELIRDDQLTEIWNLAKWPPTMFNVQPLRVLFVRTPEGFDRLLPHLNDRNQVQSASAPVTALLALDRDYHQHVDLVGECQENGVTRSC